MQVVIVNQSRLVVKEALFQKAFDQIVKKLLKVSALKNKSKLKRAEIALVFVSPQKIKNLNAQFRHKNYATDILSFNSDDVQSLGELVLCPQVLKKQAKQNDHSLDFEILYMLIHGVLHLLGYDHEISKAEEKKMFFLQDRLFRQLTAGKINLKLIHVNRSRAK